MIQGQRSRVGASAGSTIPVDYIGTPSSLHPVPLVINVMHFAGGSHIVCYLSLYHFSFRMCVQVRCLSYWNMSRSNYSFTVANQNFYSEYPILGTEVERQCSLLKYSGITRATLNKQYIIFRLSSKRDWVLSRYYIDYLYVSSYLFSNMLTYMNRICISREWITALVYEGKPYSIVIMLSVTIIWFRQVLKSYYFMTHFFKLPRRLWWL